MNHDIRSWSASTPPPGYYRKASRLVLRRWRQRRGNVWDADSEEMFSEWNQVWCSRGSFRFILLQIDVFRAECELPRTWRIRPLTRRDSGKRYLNVSIWYDDQNLETLSENKVKHWKLTNLPVNKVTKHQFKGKNVKLSRLVKTVHSSETCNKKFDFKNFFWNIVLTKMQFQFKGHILCSFLVLCLWSRAPPQQPHTISLAERFVGVCLLLHCSPVFLSSVFFTPCPATSSTPPLTVIGHNFCRFRAPFS